MSRFRVFPSIGTGPGLLLVLAWAGVLVQAAGAGSGRSGAAPAAQQPAAAAEYVGQATCLGCHEEKAYKGTLHALTSNPTSPAATHGCESCHGPGKAHADSGDAKLIVNLKTLSPQRASETCVMCHDKAKHGLWSGSQHDQRNVGCVTCHSVHAPKGPHQIKAASEPELCATCHRNIVNKLHRFNHMPVREGKVQC